MPYAMCDVGQLSMAIFILRDKNVPKITYLTVSVIPDNKITWKMNHFLLTSNDKICA